MFLTRDLPMVSNASPLLELTHLGAPLPPPPFTSQHLVAVVVQVGVWLPIRRPGHCSVTSFLNTSLLKKPFENLEIKSTVLNTFIYFIKSCYEKPASPSFLFSSKVHRCKHLLTTTAAPCLLCTLRQTKPYRQLASFLVTLPHLFVEVVCRYLNLHLEQQQNKI